MARDSGIVPRCYGVRIVRRGKSFRVGILMQHLGNKRLADLSLPDKKISGIYDKLHDGLISFGVEHKDLHDENIMFFKNKFYAIDFSPECVEVPESN
jgi:RIO-like serine/threonine protein kinase